jgi:hypothetical protein
MLADPDIQNVIQNFGGPLEQLPAENGVEKSIVARYGAELAAQLNQFSVAQKEVQNQYCGVFRLIVTADSGIVTGDSDDRDR